MLKHISPFVLAIVLTLLFVAPTLAHEGEDEASLNGGIVFAVLGVVSVSGMAFLRQKAWKLDSFDLGIVVLTALTAVLHLMIGLEGDFLLLLNGAGALVILTLIYVPIDAFQSYQKSLLWILFGYMILTFGGYFVSHSFEEALDNRLGMTTKVIELLLIGLLFIKNRLR